MEAVYTFSIAGEKLPEGTQVVAFRGSEAISKPYRVEVFLRVAEGALADFDPRDVLGRRATLAFHRDDGEVRRVVHGMWSAIALARALPGGDALFRATLSPRLWRLSLARRSRVFVGRTLPEIVASVLDECGFGEGEYDLRLERRYEPLDHVCQYRETSLDFVARRLEHEGIYYYFEHPVEGAAERLVITDSITFAESLGTGFVRFLATDEELGAVEGLHTLECQYAAVPSGARTFGYDYLRPGVDVGGDTRSDPDDPFVVSSWEPVSTEADARRLAQVRAETLRARGSVLEGSGRVFDVRAGYLFEVEEHPVLSGEYLATGVEFRGCDVVAHKELARKLGFDKETYTVDVTAIPGDVQFRPERVTRRPRVHGMELGVVRGPLKDSPYAQVDEHGRYLVQLLFDEERSKVTPSTRMRMAQPHGGAHGAGAHFPLRNGTEVLVSFVGGDPDAPVIAGVVPNADTASPVTRDNATRNVVQTGGGNRLEIEDQQGGEYVAWQTPYKHTSVHLGAQSPARYEVEHKTDGSGHLGVGGDYDVAVGDTKTEFVAVQVWEHFGPEAPDLGASDLSMSRTYVEAIRAAKEAEAAMGAYCQENGTPPDDSPLVAKLKATRAHLSVLEKNGAASGLWPSETHRVDVGGSRKTTVTGDVTEIYGAKQTTAVTGPVARTFGLATNDQLTTTPEGALAPKDEPTDPTLVTDVHGHEVRRVHGTLYVSCDALTEEILGEKRTTFTSDGYEISRKDSYKETHGHSYTRNYGPSTKLNVAASEELNVGASAKMNVSTSAELALAMATTLKIGYSMGIALAGSLDLKVGVSVTISGNVDLKADICTLKSGEISLKRIGAMIEKAEVKLGQSGLEVKV